MNAMDAVPKSMSETKETKKNSPINGKFPKPVIWGTAKKTQTMLLTMV